MQGKLSLHLWLLSGKTGQEPGSIRPYADSDIKTLMESSPHRVFLTESPHG